MIPDLCATLPKLIAFCQLTTGCHFGWGWLCRFAPNQVERRHQNKSFFTHNIFKGVDYRTGAAFNWPETFKGRMHKEEVAGFYSKVAKITGELFTRVQQFAL